eukprot:Clim_evm17s33 gene=Clim_evmTU17s33
MRDLLLLVELSEYEGPRTVIIREDNATVPQQAVDRFGTKDGQQYETRQGTQSNVTASVLTGERGTDHTECNPAGIHEEELADGEGQEAIFTQDAQHPGGSGKTRKGWDLDELCMQISSIAPLYSAYASTLSMAPGSEDKECTERSNIITAEHTGNGTVRIHRRKKPGHVALIRFFDLGDLAARGLSRRFALAYVTADIAKAHIQEHNVLDQFSSLVDRAHIGNACFVVAQAETRLRNLRFTAQSFTGSVDADNFHTIPTTEDRGLSLAQLDRGHETEITPLNVNMHIAAVEADQSKYMDFLATRSKAEGTTHKQIKAILHDFWQSRDGQELEVYKVNSDQDFKGGSILTEYHSELRRTLIDVIDYLLTKQRDQFSPSGDNRDDSNCNNSHHDPAQHILIETLKKTSLNDTDLDPFHHLIGRCVYEEFMTAFNDGFLSLIREGGIENLLREVESACGRDDWIDDVFRGSRVAEVMVSSHARAENGFWHSPCTVAGSAAVKEWYESSAASGNSMDVQSKFCRQCYLIPGLQFLLDSGLRKKVLVYIVFALLLQRPVIVLARPDLGVGKLDQHTQTGQQQQQRDLEIERAALLIKGLSFFVPGSLAELARQRRIVPWYNLHARRSFSTTPVGDSAGNAATNSGAMDDDTPAHDFLLYAMPENHQASDTLWRSAKESIARVAGGQKTTGSTLPADIGISLLNVQQRCLITLPYHGKMLAAFFGPESSWDLSSKDSVAFRDLKSMTASWHAMMAALETLCTTYKSLLMVITGRTDLTEVMVGKEDRECGVQILINEFATHLHDAIIVDSLSMSQLYGRSNSAAAAVGEALEMPIVPHPALSLPQAQILKM